MIETRVWRPWVGLPAMIALAAFLPACHAPGEPPAPWIRQPSADSRNVSMRPAWDPTERRPFVLGGYAGASYGPGVVGRRAFFAQPPPPQSQPSVTVDRGAWGEE
jgi:hypothetical protein